MPTTRITNNSLAANAALNNLNAGASIAFTKSVSVSGNLTVDTNTLVVDSVNNRVGIGTASPSVALHVVGDIWGNRLLYTLDTTTGIIFNSGTIFFNTSGATRIAVNNIGNVGIGTSAPNERLTVSGNLSASGDAFASGSKLSTETFAIAMAIAVG